jgi:hypothetical protein
MKQLLYIPIAALFVLSSCTKNLGSLNVDPINPAVAPAASLFTGGEKNLVDNYTSTSVSSAPFRVISQEWTENNYVYEAQYNFAAYEAPDGWWAGLYADALLLDNNQTGTVGVLDQLSDARKQYPKDIPADTGTLYNDLRIIDILEVYTYNLLVSTYGNIPYTQALNDTIPFPKYDDAKTVFYDLLTRLDTDINKLNPNSGSMGSADQIYGGNIAQWVKFAATLKLKLATYLSDIDPTTAKAKINEAIATGVFASNNDNAIMNYSSAATVNSNPLYQALVYSGRHDFCPTNLIINTMLGWNDPRLPLYFTLSLSGDGLYEGGTPGAGNGYGLFSDFSATMESPTYPGDILDYSETEFLLAEAAARGFIAGSPTPYYDDAITASIEFYGGAASDAATYLAQPAVAYATAAGTWQQKIGYQKWIAFYNRNWDSWTEIRRLGYPDLDVVNPPNDANGNLPLRFTYPTIEVTANPTSYNAAVAAQGGSDVVSGKIFWMP